MSALLARRSLLQRALSAVGFATVLYPAPKPAASAPKISKQAVAYQDHPEGVKRCSDCVQFQPPDACKMVDGAINPQGYCRIFVLRKG